MNINKINKIKSNLEPSIKQLSEHPLYKQISTIDDVITFMSCHVYCVWDFMNLLTTLQKNLSCVDVPWYPVKSVNTVRLINELVLEEASDKINGEYTSHFSFYIKALKTIQPGHHHHDQFLTDINNNAPYSQLINARYLPSGVSPFLTFTYQCIQESIIDVAAAFTFGREVIIPSLFTPLVTQLSSKKREDLHFFITYLERHIELDGGSHSKIAEEMISELCQSEADWERVESVAMNALNARKALWDSISNRLNQLKTSCNLI
jgi:hypothetical protein